MKNQPLYCRLARESRQNVLGCFSLLSHTLGELPTDHCAALLVDVLPPSTTLHSLLLKILVPIKMSLQKDNQSSTFKELRALFLQNVLFCHFSILITLSLHSEKLVRPVLMPLTAK